MRTNALDFATTAIDIALLELIDAPRGRLKTDDDIEKDIVRAARDGDHSAFDMLYTRYSPRIYNRVRASIPADDAEDVTQDVFLAAVRGLSRFDERSSFGTWLSAIANHKIVDYYRRRPKMETVPLHWSTSGEGDGVGLPRFAEPVADEPGSHDDRMVVRAALDRLPVRYREVLLLRLAADMGFAQIAERLALTEEAARSLFRRAVSACRAALVGMGVSQTEIQ